MLNKEQAGNQPMGTINVICTAPTTPAAGDPVVIGLKCGVAETPEDAAGYTVVDIMPGIFTLSVKGINAGGNSAVAVNDAIYYTSGDTPPLSKKNTGVLFGQALATVGSGLTATIRVWKFGA